MSRARLYADRLELLGIGWQGLYRHTVPLIAVNDAIWWTGSADCNLELRLKDGDSLSLWMSGAGLWKLAIDECLAILLNPPAHDLGIAHSNLAGVSQA